MKKNTPLAQAKANAKPKRNYIAIYRHDRSGNEIRTVAKWRGGSVEEYIDKYIKLLRRRGDERFIPHRAVAHYRGTVTRWASAPIKKPVTGVESGRRRVASGRK